MKKFILFLFFLPAFVSNAQINKVEHFFVSSPEAERLFNLFKEQFQLPVVWRFQKYKDFASGGLSLGNVVFEFLTRDTVTDARFGGIALEPTHHIDEFIEELDRLEIAHDTVQNNTRVKDNGVLTGWSNVRLPDLLPTHGKIFVCDYKERDKVAAGRKKASDSLRLNNGGPIGVVGLYQIVLKSSVIEGQSQFFSKLSGILKKEGTVFEFSSGPSIKLSPSSDNGIEKIVIKVTSLTAAKKYLAFAHLLGQTTNNSIFINPNEINGLLVELIE